jgi:hypothetical protein
MKTYVHARGDDLKTILRQTGATVSAPAVAQVMEAGASFVQHPCAGVVARVRASLASPDGFAGAQDLLPGGRNGIPKTTNETIT